MEPAPQPWGGDSAGTGTCPPHCGHRRPLPTVETSLDPLCSPLSALPACLHFHLILSAHEGEGHTLHLGHLLLSTQKRKPLLEVEAH